MTEDGTTRPSDDQAAQRPDAYVTHTQGQISIEILTDVSGKVVRVEERMANLIDNVKGIESRILDAIKTLDGKMDLAVRSVESRVESSVKAMENRLDGSIKTLDTKVDTCARDLAKFDEPFKELKSDVKDLVNWKHKVWGMVIVLSALFATATAVWAFVSGHIQWKPDPEPKLPAASAPAVTPPPAHGAG